MFALGVHVFYLGSKWEVVAVSRSDNTFLLKEDDNHKNVRWVEGEKLILAAEE